MAENEELKSLLMKVKEESASLFADDMILYIENPKDSTIKLLKLMNDIKLTCRI